MKVILAVLYHTFHQKYHAVPPLHFEVLMLYYFEKKISKF